MSSPEPATVSPEVASDPVRLWWAFIRREIDLETWYALALALERRRP